MYRVRNFSGTVQIDKKYKKNFFFLGDAAFGTPFYKGLSNGFKLLDICTINGTYTETSNLLYQNGVLCVCDFGLARKYGR